MDGPRVPVGGARGGAGLMDRIASLVLPRISDLGAPGTLLAPVVIVSLLSLLALAGLEPVLGAAAGQGEAVASVMRSSVRLLALLAPVFTMIRGGALSCVAWAVLVLIGAAPRFRCVASAVLYGEAVLALQGLWISLVLQVRAAGGTLSRHQLHVASGLDGLGVPSSPAVAALVQGLSVFHLVWLLLLCLAFAHAATTTRLRGAVAALAVWSLVVGLTVLRAALG